MNMKWIKPSKGIQEKIRYLEDVRDQEVVRLRDEEELSFGRIAELLGITDRSGNPDPAWTHKIYKKQKG